MQIKKSHNFLALYFVCNPTTAVTDHILKIKKNNDDEHKRLWTQKLSKNKK